MPACPRSRRSTRSCHSSRASARASWRASAWTSTCGTAWGATTDRSARLVALAQDVVAPDALATLHPPAEEGAVEAQRAQVERRPARHLARDPAREALLVDPQLEPGVALAAAVVVGRRQARLGDVDRVRLAVLAALDDGRGERLVGVLVLARGPDRGQRDGEIVAQPRRDRARELDAPPVRCAPGVPALPEAVDGDARVADTGVAAHAQRLLVAGHSARAGDRGVG